MNMTRRSFLKLLTTAIATPIIAKVSAGLILPEAELALPKGIEIVHEMPKDPFKVAAGFAEGYFSMGGPPTSFYDHILTKASMSLPYGVRFELRGVPMSADEMSMAGAPGHRHGYQVLWITEDWMQQDPQFPTSRRYLQSEYGSLNPHERGSDLLLTPYLETDSVPVLRADHVLYASWVSGMPL